MSLKNFHFYIPLPSLFLHMLIKDVGIYARILNEYVKEKEKEEEKNTAYMSSNTTLYLSNFCQFLLLIYILLVLSFYH